MKSKHKEFPALAMAMRAQIKKDNSALRRELFEVFAARSGVVRKIYGFVAQWPTLGTLACFFYGYRASLGTLRAKGKIVAYYSLKNEYRALRSFMSAFEIRAEFVEIPSGFCLDFQKLKWLVSFRKISRLFCFFKSLLKKYPLYVVMRASEVYFTFAALMTNHEKDRPEKVYFSSEGSPHGRAVIAIAQTMGIESHFVCHAPSVIQPSPLAATSGNFTGEAGLHEYLEKGAVFERFNIKNFLMPQMPPVLKKIPINSPIEVCICLSKESGTQALENEILNLKKILNIGKVTVRPHPHRLTKANHSFAELSSDQKSLEQLRNFDLVVAGSSNVHFEGLTRGVPTLYCEGFDVKASPLYKFIAENLVFNSKISPVSAESINEHYSADSWQKKMNLYVQSEK